MKPIFKRYLPHTILVGFLLTFCCTDLMAAGPVIETVSPRGVERGKRTVLTIEGTKLEGTNSIVFEDRALKATILGVDSSVAAEKSAGGSEKVDTRRSCVRTEVDVDVSARPGLHGFRLLTPQGITAFATLAIGRFSEINEVEPNDSEEPQSILLPATLAGEISDLADIDCFLFEAKAGQEIVFESFVQRIGSSLDPVLEVLDDSGHIVHQAEIRNAQDPVFGYRFSKSGKFRLRIRDFQNRGGAGFYYRVNLGELPLVTRYFPIGVPLGSSADVSLEGFNLGTANSIKVAGPKGEKDGTIFSYHPTTPKDESINPLSFVITSEQGRSEQEPNDRLEQAQMLTLPATVQGRISGDESSTDVDWYSFSAKRGQKLSLEIVASRVGSPLDSVVEVFDDKGREIRRATVRCTQETTTILGVGSQGDQLSFSSTNGLAANDLVMVGSELGQVVAVSSGCEADVRVRNLNGQRFPLWETTAETHPGGVPAYKVDVFPGEVSLPPNGLPLFYMTARNDDGGPFYGKDSHLSFSAPTDGRYFIEIKDVRGFQGENFVYQFSIREDVPDFEMTYSPSGLTITRGATVPLTIWVNRSGGFDGEIQVDATDLPDGVSASPAVIPAGQNSTVFLLSASAGASACCLNAQSLILLGQATLQGQKITRRVRPLEPFPAVTVTDETDLKIAVAPQELTMQPGEVKEIKVKVERLKGFDGDVSIVVRNLPPGVMVDPSMVNFELGNSIPKGQNSLTLRLVAAASTRPVVQPIHVVAASAQLNFNNPTGTPEVTASPIRLAIVQRGTGLRGSEGTANPK